MKKGVDKSQLTWYNKDTIKERWYKIMAKKLSYLSKMENTVISTYGLESKQTIDFLKACEIARTTGSADDILFCDDLYEILI